MVSQMLLQDVVVLQMGNFPLEKEEELEQQQEEAAAQEGQEEGTEEAPPPVEKPDVVTLIVTPQDAVTLNYLMFGGAKMTLALRNIYDPDRLVVNPVTLQFLLEQYQIPVPVRLPYGLHPRVDDVIEPVLRNDIPQQ
jgi:pilus assembly protein CpaB